MRETSLSLRERTFPPETRPREAAFLLRHRTTFGIAAAGAVLMAGVGAFGTGTAPPAALYTYWFIVMLTGACVGGWTLDLSGAITVPRAKLPARAAATLVAASILMTPLVWVLAAFIVHGSSAPGKMLHIFPQVILLAAAFVGVILAIERRPGRGPPAAPQHGPSPLLLRLPDKLRGARIEAVEAEDHYLRVHTDAGSALILMRLSDAVEELAATEGARTHRSWWVARSAVRAARRGGGRATLQLAGGLQVPVSRAYARELRRQGWF